MAKLRPAPQENVQGPRTKPAAKAGSAVMVQTMEPNLTLNGISVALNSSAAQEFVVDATRAGEGLISDADLREKYELTAKDLAGFAKNKSLAARIRAKAELRVRNGVRAREHAAQVFVRAPAVLGEILDDRSASPRHRIESARELRATSTAGADDKNGAGAEMFSIIINLGSDATGKPVIERYEKTLKPAVDVDEFTRLPSEPIDW